MSSGFWLTKAPAAEIALVCFPFAGAGGHVFAQWSRHFGSAVSLRSVQLPGRGVRLKEAPIRSWPMLRQELLQALRPLTGDRYAFFGHSMGALMAYDMALALHGEGLPPPEQLFLSAHRAPHLPNPSPPTTGMDDQAFLRKLRDLNGTPAEVLANRELMAMLLPALRADMELVESYACPTPCPLPTPIVAFAGTGDRSTAVGEVMAWQEFTSAEFSAHEFSGDHFYIFPHAQQLAALMSTTLLAPAT